MLPKIQPGDIIGFSGYGPIHCMINICTFGIPGYHISHIAIVGKDLRLYESTPYTTLKCELRDAQIFGTQVHSLQPEMDAFWGKMYHYPLLKPLDMCQTATLHSFLMSQMGKGYDFVGALRAAGKIYAYIQGMLHPASSDYLFCSEFCAFAHSHIGVFRSTNESKWSPNAFVRAERRFGILGKAVRIK